MSPGNSNSEGVTVLPLANRSHRGSYLQLLVVRGSFLHLHSCASIRSTSNGSQLLPFVTVSLNILSPSFPHMKQEWRYESYDAASDAAQNTHFEDNNSRSICIKPTLPSQFKSLFFLSFSFCRFFFFFDTCIMVTRIHPLLIQSITNNKKNIYKAIFQIKLTRRSFSQSLPQSLQHQKEKKEMRPLTIDGLNPALLKVQYAVRGELAIKAETLREKLKESDHGLPFDKVISSNIGNPQQKGLDQPPITFTRQVS